jgi:hypothetical protein
MNVWKEMGRSERFGFAIESNMRHSPIAIAGTGSFVAPGTQEATDAWIFPVARFPSSSLVSTANAIEHGNARNSITFKVVRPTHWV